MTTALWLVIIITFLAWIYDFYNGANDCANSIATTVSSRVLSPTKAIILAAVFNTVGAFISTEVAKTIGKGLLPENLMTTAVLVSAIIGAIAWSAYATHAGLPVSITHSIIGGIFGAGLVAYGFGAFKLQIFKKNSHRHDHLADFWLSHRTVSPGRHLLAF